MDMLTHRLARTLAPLLDRCEQELDERINSGNDEDFEQLQLDVTAAQYALDEYEREHGRIVRPATEMACWAPEPEAPRHGKAIVFTAIVLLVFAISALGVVTSAQCMRSGDVPVWCVD